VYADPFGCPSGEEDHSDDDGKNDLGEDMGSVAEEFFEDLKELKFGRKSNREEPMIQL